MLSRLLNFSGTVKNGLDKMRRSLILFLTSFIVFSASFAFAMSAPISVKASVDKAFVTVGDKITFKLEIKHNPKIDILSFNPEQKLRDFEIKSKRDIVPFKDGNDVVEGKIYVLTNYTLGDFVIDPISIRYKDLDGSIKEIKTNKLYITVESVEKSNALKRDIRDIKSVTGLPSQAWKFILAIVSMALVLLIVAFIWLFVKRRDILMNFFKPPLKPHDAAIQALNRLQDSGLLARGNVREFYFQMSEILKHYMEKRFGFKALEDTNSEILNEFIRLEMPNDALDVLKKFFDASDLVKFAKYVPEPINIQQDFKLAMTFIEKTKPVEVDEKDKEAPVAKSA